MERDGFDITVPFPCSLRSINTLEFDTPVMHRVIIDEVFMVLIYDLENDKRDKITGTKLFQ